MTKTTLNNSWDVLRTSHPLFLMNHPITFKKYRYIKDRPNLIERDNCQYFYATGNSVKDLSLTELCENFDVKEDEDLALGSIGVNDGTSNYHVLMIDTLDCSIKDLSTALQKLNNDPGFQHYTGFKFDKPIWQVFKTQKGFHVYSTELVDVVNLNEWWAMLLTLPIGVVDTKWIGHQIVNGDGWKNFSTLRISESKEKGPITPLVVET